MPTRERPRRWNPHPAQGFEQRPPQLASARVGGSARHLHPRPFSRPRLQLLKILVLHILHVLAASLTLGLCLGLAFVVVPRSRRLGDAAATRAALASVLKVVDPALIALLGVLVMTGAYQVTGLKQDLGFEYFTSFAQHFASKLGLAFLVVMAGTWLSMGIGHRLVREEGYGEPPEAARINSLAARLRGAAITVALLLLATITFSLRH